MSSIYIHIPFCKTACSYCNFHFSTNKQQEDKMISAIKKEIELQQYFFPNTTIISTIYFGGGTPSILKIDSLKQILNQIKAFFTVDENVEITLEINPDDVNNEKIKQWLEIGFNRFSIGIQSLFDEDLLYLKRTHHAEQSIQSIELLLKNNVKNISADLIFGIPTSSILKINHNLNFLTQLGIPHLSCYGLTVEPKTLLYHNIKQKKILPINQTQQAEEFSFVMNYLEQKGYEQYEISNYAIENFRSKHNSAYWDFIPYLGLGPSAHSYNGTHRQSNIANNALYISSLENNVVPYEKEILTQKQLYNEFILTQIRKKEGILLNDILVIFSEQYFHHLQKQLKNIPLNYFTLNKNVFQLTNQGKLFCDWISMQLFI